MFRAAELVARRAGRHTAAGIVPTTPHAARRPPQRTTLKASPALAPSHTTVAMPLGVIDLFGNYSVLGPAVIRKVNNALVALVQPGGAVSVLSSSSGAPTLMPAASLSRDGEEPGAGALVTLSGRHLELEGSFELLDTRAGIPHDGKLIVGPDHLSEGSSCITLLPGGSVSHPLNVHPQAPHRGGRQPGGQQPRQRST